VRGWCGGDDFVVLGGDCEADAAGFRGLDAVEGALRRDLVVAAAQLALAELCSVSRNQWTEIVTSVYYTCAPRKPHRVS
jgi:hypothetical protein